MAFAIESGAFANGRQIPSKYTRDGENVSPPLSWADPPQGTQSYLILVEDPDAPSGTFRHWAAYNVPSDWTGLREGLGTEPSPEHIRQGMNDFGHARYDGPAPPKGHGTHHYHFRLAALNTPQMELPPLANADEIWRSAQRYIIGQTEIVGVYAR